MVRATSDSCVILLPVCCVWNILIAKEGENCFFGQISTSRRATRLPSRICWTTRLWSFSRRTRTTRCTMDGTMPNCRSCYWLWCLRPCRTFSSIPRFPSTSSPTPAWLGKFKNLLSFCILCLVVVQLADGYLVVAVYIAEQFFLHSGALGHLRHSDREGHSAAADAIGTDWLLALYTCGWIADVLVD